jgi:ATP dependent DNA ligase-like protein
LTTLIAIAHRPDESGPEFSVTRFRPNAPNGRNRARNGCLRVFEGSFSENIKTNLESSTIYDVRRCGVSEKGLQDTMERLRPLFIDKSPVVNPPKIPEKIQWVQPKLVCEVAFAEWTQDGELRQTTFLGWREDKQPIEVVLE